jgi:acetyl-CoA carboxylase biotin carboxyl carrier protein
MPQKFDTAFIRNLAELLNETDLSEIEVEQEGLRIKVARQVNIQAAAPVSYAPAPVAAPIAAPAAAVEAVAAPVDPAKHPGAIKSPMVGTAYHSSEPGAAPFIEIGKAIKEGDTVMLIEAMKTFNPIVAAKAGIVKQIIIGDGQPVEYGEVLLIIE